MAAGPSVAVSEAWPELVLTAEKDLREWIPSFLRLIFAIPENVEWLEAGQMARGIDEDG